MSLYFSLGFPDLEKGSCRGGLPTCHYFFPLGFPDLETDSCVCYTQGGVDLVNFPLPTPRTPLFRRGSREIDLKVDPLSRGGFTVAFHGPPPDGGASRRKDGDVVVLVVADPFMGSRPRPPPEGEGGDG